MPIPSQAPPVSAASDLPRRRGITFSIAKKIWLSLSLLLIGYAGTMALGFVRGVETRERLTGFADQGFPAAVESQAALTAFKEQVALYADAVIMGEAEALDEAGNSSIEALEALRRLQAPLRDNDPRKHSAEDLLNRIENFTARARPVYEAMSTSMDVEGLFQKAEDLAAEFTALEADLFIFRESIANGVMNGLHDLSEATTRIWYTNFAVFLGVVIGAFGLASLIIHRWITSPLKQASEFAQLMAAGDLSQKLDFHQRDELGDLARAFNKMATEVERAQSGLEEQVASRTWELEEAHRKLMVTAHMAGMAEVASSVLHNVGNVLNSVNVTADSLRSRVRESRVDKLTSVCDLMRDNEGDLHHFFEVDPRGSKLVPYVIKLAEHLADERSTHLEMLETLHDHVEHITTIISQQQSNSRAQGLTESIELPTLLADAIALADRSACSPGLKLEEHIEGDPPIALADRHKVLQILVNLINNAYQALNVCETREPCLRIEMRTSAEGMAELRMIDNGIGISPENVKRVFSHGFTTKAEGHGYGLHSSILAAQEMGGTLTVISDGEQRGASFCLTLPSAIQESFGA
ncbi:MAG: signal transduction histidine kinase [Planctomycetota bacterium]|jgi:signal transduction histidine kinase